MKSGDARVALIGFPSVGTLHCIPHECPLLIASLRLAVWCVGKSTFLTTVTKTESEVAAYEFTTLTCIPGSSCVCCAVCRVVCCSVCSCLPLGVLRCRCDR